MYKNDYLEINEEKYLFVLHLNVLKTSTINKQLLFLKYIVTENRIIYY